MKFRVLTGHNEGTTSDKEVNYNGAKMVVKLF